MKKAVNAPNINYAWAGLMVEELGRLGVGNFFISPGSRSSPLALAAADSGASVTVHFDERGTAFAALGCARATGRPSVVITTSGTAVANLHPAVCEASMDNVPMIVITADRPPELRDTGANQTMDQVKFFQGFVRWQVDMPCPDTSVPACFVLRTMDHAFSRAVGVQPGPVHINQMFREPLAPERCADGSAAWLRTVQTWAKSAAVHNVHFPGAQTPDAASIKAARGLVERSRRGVIVAGTLEGARSRNAVLALAQELDWPVLPDIRSGLRFDDDNAVVIGMADQVLLSDAARRGLVPDTVLYLGGRATSKRILHFIRDTKASVLMVSPSPARLDVTDSQSIRVASTIDAFVTAVGGVRSLNPASWKKKWQRADRAVTNLWTKLVGTAGRLSEPMVAALVSAMIPAKHILSLASSMPVRDMEMYAMRTGGARFPICNRGVSGIDGCVATTIGAIHGAGSAATLVIGDLALLHDLNSLALAARCPKPLTIVAINNNGGGIFSFLPVSGAPRHFETCFGTPHGFGFADATAMFGLNYSAPENVSEFKAAYTAALKSGSHSLIEVRTDRDENVNHHQAIQSQLKSRIDHVLRG